MDKAIFKALMAGAGIAQTDYVVLDYAAQTDAHIADESWASGGNGTAPDILILKTNINRSCWECHEPRKLHSSGDLEAKLHGQLRVEV